MKIQFYTDYCHKVYQVKFHRSKIDMKGNSSINILNEVNDMGSYEPLRPFN